MRKLNIFFIILIATLVVVFFGASWFLGAESSGEIIEDTPNEFFVEKTRTQEYIVQKGDVWGNLAEKLGIGRELSASLLAASEDIHSLVSIRTGNKFRFLFDAQTNEFERVEYDIDKEEFLAIGKNKDSGEFEAQVAKIHYITEVVIGRGVIESSLFETAEAEGIEPGVILDLAWIFSWDVDFASSVQAGDSFVVAYEKRYRDGEYVGAGQVLAARFTNSGHDFYSFYYQKSDEEKGSYYDEEGKELKRQFLKSPLDYSRITSGFSYNRYHPILNTFTTHRAIDYAASSGTPVSATADGTVNYVGWKGGNGMYVGVTHGNGYRTGYAHLSAYGKGVWVGARVKQNQVVGFVGSTGLSIGPHLHYEMLKNGVFINPLALNLPKGEEIGEEYRVVFLEERARLMKLLEK